MTRRSTIFIGSLMAIAAAAMGCSVLLDLDRLREGADQGMGDLAGADLTGADLAGADLTGEDLAGVDLSSSDLAGTTACVPPPGGVLSFRVDDTVTLTTNLKAFAVADVNRDGGPDLIAAIYDGSQSQLRVYKRTPGSQAFSTSFATFSAGCSAANWVSDLYAGDFDGDKLTDLIVFCHYDGVADEMYLVRWNADGSMATTQAFQAPAQIANPAFGAVADLDLDGHDDLIVNDVGKDSLVLYWGATLNQMLTGAVERFYVGTELYGVSAATLVGSGRPTIASAHSGGTLADMGADPGHVSIIRPASATAGTRGFQMPSFVNLAASPPTSLAIGRFDSNMTSRDIALIDYSGGLRLMSGDGAGDFATVTFAGSGPTQSKRRGVGDLDCDGLDDLAISHVPLSFGVDSVISVQKANSSGLFTSVPLPAAATANRPEWPVDMYIADLDGDGRRDIAVSMFGNSSRILRILWSQGP